MMRTALFLIAAALHGLCRAPVNGPQNVSCIGRLYEKSSSPRVTCMWDHDQHTTDISYTVYLKLDKVHTCVSLERNCTFPDTMIVLFNYRISIRVTAQDSRGYSADSDEVIYSNVWKIVQMDSPEEVIAEFLQTGLRVTWKVEEKFGIGKEDTEYEVQLREKGSYAKPVVISVESGAIDTIEVNEVKPCTNYTTSMRSRFHDSVWSTWSHEVTALSYINVSSLQFHLWRSRSVSGDQGKRIVQLMWKGVPPSCNAVDEYFIFWDSLKLSKCFGPYQNHTFITLDERPHRITVAAFRNDTSLNDASIVVPAMAEEVNLPPVRNISVFVQHGFIEITWEKPRLPASGYIIVWNSTAKSHMWQRLQKTNFTLMVEPSAIYTISLIPLYEDGPGNEIILNNCTQEKNLPAVSNVQVTRLSDQRAEIHWLPLVPSQCCAFVLNYKVFYKTNDDLRTRNVTVGASQQHVILEDLQANTMYSVYVMASTVTASSKSVPIIFSTNPSKLFLIVLVLCSVVLIVLSMLAMMIRRKFSSKKIPDPRFSSLSMWPSEKCRNPWSLFPEPGGKNTETILPCHVDSEVVSVSPTSKKVMAAVKTLTEIQNITYETTWTPNTPLADGLSDKGQLINGGKKQRVPLVPSLDLGNSPQEFPHPHVQLQYRKHTELSSPVDSPTQPPLSEDRDTANTNAQKHNFLY